MSLWSEIKAALRLLVSHSVFLSVKLALAGLLVAADLGLEKLAGLVLEHDSHYFRIVEAVLDVTFVGSAIVIAACGAVMIAGAVLFSTISYFKEMLSDD